MRAKGRSPTSAIVPPAYVANNNFNRSGISNFHCRDEDVNRATLALNTTMRSCEIKGLLWRDVDFLERTLTIRHSKTAAGERVLPLNAEAMAAILELRERAKALGGTESL